MPLVVSVGFVMGAEMALARTAERKPCEDDPMGNGEPGGTLSYGMERNSPPVDTEGWRGRDFFLPNRLSIITKRK